MIQQQRDGSGRFIPRSPLEALADRVARAERAAASALDAHEARLPGWRFELRRARRLIANVLVDVDDLGDASDA